MNMRISIIDYGSGNLHSVIKAFQQLGALVKVTSDPGDVARAERLVLPGVGAFEDGMAGLDKRGLISGIQDYFSTERPFLGICLGMQMLLTESEEFGLKPGMGVIPGRVTEIPVQKGYKVPHIGWSRIQPRPEESWSGSILEDVVPGTRVYFVHSFSAQPAQEEHRLADTMYGNYRISAAIQRGQVVGCQFHPEKSGPLGLKILERFLRL